MYIVGSESALRESKLNACTSRIMKSRKVENSSIGGKVAAGAAWLTVATMLTRILGAVKMLILAAILPQNELGLFGLALVSMQLVEQLSETGIRQAIIQKQGEVEDYLPTAFTSQLVRNLLISLFLFATAGYWETFFGKPGVADALQLLSLLPLIQGSNNVCMLLLNRELNFGPGAILSIITGISDFLLLISFAYHSPFAESLILARLCAAVLCTATTYVLESRRVAIGFSLDLFRELSKFGVWIFVSSIVVFILTRGSDLVVGKMLTLEDLATYQLASTLACMPMMSFAQVLSNVSFPAYSNLIDKPERLASAFLRTLTLIGFVGGFFVAGALVASKSFTSVFLRPEYAEVATLLPMLCIWGVCRALGSTNSVIFQAIGKPHLATLFQFIMLALFAVILIPLTWLYGLTGIAISLMLIGLLAQLGRYQVLQAYTAIRVKEVVFRILAASTVSLLSVAISVLICQIPTISHSPGVYFACSIIAMTTSFGVLAAIADAKLQFGIFRFAENSLPASVRNKIPSFLRA